MKGPNYTLEGSQSLKDRLVDADRCRQAGKICNSPTSGHDRSDRPLNPTWNVPPSIIHNEYLPALQRDPTALMRIGLRIGRNADGSIRIYQPPSDRNALGRHPLSISQTASSCTNMIRPTSSFLKKPSAPTAMAACASTCPTNMPRCWGRSRNPRTVSVSVQQIRSLLWSL